MAVVGGSRGAGPDRSQQVDASNAMLKLQSAIEDTERLGEKFMAVKQQMVDIDRQRQALREALTALRRQPPSLQQKSVYMQRPGGMLLKLSVDGARRMMEADQCAVEAKLEVLRKEQKRLVALLADKGATPGEVGPGLLGAMLNLRGESRGGQQAVRESYDPNELD